MAQAQLFPPRSNLIARIIVALLVLLPIAALIGLYAWWWSPSITQAGVPVAQPINYSHQLHVGLKIDCRYCHTAVEKSNSAGLPSTQTCMTCHTQIKPNSPNLAVMMDSWQNNKPIQWNKVYDLPSHVYFNHSIHLTGGIGCSTCHGNMGAQAVVARQQPLHMSWCLTCHTNPEQFVRPKEELFNPTYQFPADHVAKGRELLIQNKVEVSRLKNCSVCHR
jgi:hypothetical protein